MKKLFVLTTLAILGIGNVNGATVDQRLNTIEGNMHHLDQTLMDVNNAIVIRDLNLQKQINDLKKQGYDDSEIKQALNEHGEKQTELADKLIKQEANHNELKTDVSVLTEQSNSNTQRLNTLEDNYNSLKSETRKGISQAIAIAGIEYPTYDDEHKFKIAVSTGTYKGQTSVAYGFAYTPNYDTIISVKGTDESTAVSVGFNL